MIEAMIEHYIY